jgi:hypothetical protein
MVLIDGVGVPAVHQFMEALVFYVPSPMPQTHDQLGGGLGGGQGRHPHPFRTFLRHPPAGLTAHHLSFLRAHHAQRNRHLRP